jgi:hypothetical protein
MNTTSTTKIIFLLKEKITSRTLSDNIKGVPAENQAAQKNIASAIRQVFCVGIFANVSNVKITNLSVIRKSSLN